MLSAESIEALFDESAPDSLKDRITCTLLCKPVVSTSSGNTFSLSTLSLNNFVDPISKEKATPIPNRGKEKELDDFYGQQIKLLLQGYLADITKDAQKQAEACYRLVTFIKVGYPRKEFTSVLNSFKEIIRLLNISLDKVALSLNSLDNTLKSSLVNFLVKENAINVLEKILKNETLKIILANNRELLEVLSSSSDDKAVEFYINVMSYCNSVPVATSRITSSPLITLPPTIPPPKVEYTPTNPKSKIIDEPVPVKPSKPKKKIRKRI